MSPSVKSLRGARDRAPSYPASAAAASGSSVGSAVRNASGGLKRCRTPQGAIPSAQEGSQPRRWGPFFRSKAAEAALAGFWRVQAAGDIDFLDCQSRNVARLADASLCDFDDFPRDQFSQWVTSVDNAQGPQRLRIGGRSGRSLPAPSAYFAKGDKWASAYSGLLKHHTTGNSWLGISLPLVISLSEQHGVDLLYSIDRQ